MIDLKIYMISLANQNPRRVGLLERLAEIGFHVELFDAVDGRQGLDQSLEAHVDRATGTRVYARCLTDTELACSLSHREVYLRFLSSPANWAVVLEDDAIFDERLNYFLKYRGFMAAPILLLDHRNAYVSGSGVKLRGTGSQAFRLVTSPVIATGYSLNRMVAHRLVEAQTPIKYLADFPVDISTLGGMAAVPKIVDHPKAHSLSQIGDCPHTALRYRIMRMFEHDYIRKRLRKQLGKLRSAKVS